MKKTYVMALLLWICSMTLPGRMQAQGGGCAFIAFFVEHYEPCKYELEYDNSSECYSGLRILLSEGSYVTWDANVPQGWTATLISPSELQLTHTSGIIPIGINIPIDFSIPPGISPFLSVLWDYTCPTEEGCVVDLPLEGCPVIADGCIEGFVYMECDELPFINQEVLADWTIELIDDTGNVLVSEVTSLDGAYSFCDLPAGTYVAQVRGQPGWTANVPPSGQSTIELNESEFVEQNFGLCPNCYCKDPSFTDLILHWDNGPGLSIQCETSYDGIPCPEPGNGYFFTGKFACEGDSCEVIPYVSWELIGPTGFHFGSVQASPYFGIHLLPSQISQNGIYTMSLTSFCGTDTCRCDFQFAVQCDTLCPCDLEVANALQLAVGQGFAVSSSTTSCKVCFTPIALTDCEKVDWHVSNSSGPLLGSSNGNQTFCHTFSSSGPYTIVMVVTRLKPDGTLCESFVKSKIINVACIVNPACNNSSLRNSSFSEGAIAGGFNSGGASDGWSSMDEEVEVIEGAPGSLDGWSLRLFGNLDKASVLTSLEAICLARDTGVIMLRLEGEPIPGAPQIPQGRGRSSSLAFYVSQGTNFEIGNCEEQNCYHIATIPIEDFMNGEWYDIEVPYDLRGWNLSDTCGSGALIRPVLFVTNDINSIQGGEETYSYAQIDNFCLDGMTVAVSNPFDYHRIRIFPNPTTGLLNIEMPNIIQSDISLQIISLTGQQILEKAAEPGLAVQTMDASALPQGMYFLQVLSKGQVIAVNKFVKQ